jgi:RloB-like protein
VARAGKLKHLQIVNETTRPLRPRRYDLFMLIVCEDQNTEPYYFRQFKKLFPNETVFLSEIGTGKKPKGIVEQAILERENLSIAARKTIDEVWVVFDKDDEDKYEKTKLNFDLAWKLAENENIKIAFSNEVFELWLLLHFTDVDAKSPLPRAIIFEKLENAIKTSSSHKEFEYKHGKIDVIDIVLKSGNEAKAIERAKKMVQYWKDCPPIATNPSTTTHILVKRLRDLIEFYSPIQTRK